MKLGQCALAAQVPDDSPSITLIAPDANHSPRVFYVRQLVVHIPGCHFLPEHDRLSLVRSCLLRDDFDDLRTDNCESFDSCNDGVASFVHADESTAHRVRIIQSPVPHTFYHEHPIQFTLDTGATSNMIRASSASAYRFPVLPVSQMARQADGVTPMEVVGEVHCSLIRGSSTFELDALVVRKLDVEILAGNPFLATNDIAIRPAKREIVIGGTDVVHYGTPLKITNSC